MWDELPIEFLNCYLMLLSKTRSAVPGAFTCRDDMGVS